MHRASLNHTYRLVWSDVKQAFVAVAETVRGRGKGSGRKLIAAALSFSTVVAMAGPQGGQVVLGSGAISQSGNTTTIQQSSQNLSLTWNSFNIAQPETVNFVQPSASSIAVNRILNTSASQILGHLNANGQVYLLNPNGILFGQGAQVNVGGLVASTLDLSDTSLNGNTRTFSGSGTGRVINQGSIHASSGGYVALLGNTVSNHGAITAQMGSVVLGAGSAATLTFSGNSLVGMQIDQSTLNNLANNGGLVQADGGQVIMSAGARDALLASVVNNTGVIQAHTVQNVGGNITLLGDSVVHSGRVDASGATGADTGGRIAINARQVALLDGALHADGARGGQVSVSAPHLGQSAAITAQGSGAAGGSITLAGEVIVQTAGAQLNASSTQGDGGSIDARAFKADGSGHLFSSATVDVTGQHGGSVLLSANTVDLYGASVDASGSAGGGTVLVGGDYQGHNTSVPKAQRTTLNASTQVKANATQTGDGGKVIVWSDEHTRYSGHISAQGAAAGGAGGLIEISGKQTLTYSGSANAGLGGQVLLDPTDIVITDSSGVSYIDLADPHVAASDKHGNSTGSVTELRNGNYVVSSNLWNNGSVVDAGAVWLASGTGPTADSMTPAQVAAATPNGSTLTLSASNNITVDSAVTVDGSLVLNAGNTITLNAAVTSNATSNTALVLVAGSSFVNTAGASALSTPNGKWQVWSANPGANTLGGLSPDFKQYNASYGSTTVLGSGNGNGNGVLYTLAPTLSVSLTGSVSKTYNATIDATLSAGNYSVSGSVDGDSVTLNNPTTGSFDNKNVGTGKTVSVSGITVASASNGATAVYGYGVNGSTSAAIGDITPKALTVSGISASDKVYDGTTSATVSTASVSLGGLVSGDVLTVSATGALADENVASGKTVALTSSYGGADVGNYAITNQVSTRANITPPASALNATTQLAVNVLSPQTGTRPDALGLSPTIAVTQSSSADLAAKGDAPSSSSSGTAAVVNVAMTIGSKGPALQIMNGSMKLPGNMVNVNE